jgi:hypothetical protein
MKTKIVFASLPYHLEHNVGDSFPIIPVGTVIEWDLSFTDRENPSKIRTVTGPRTVTSTKYVHTSQDGLVQYLVIS